MSRKKKRTGRGGLELYKRPVFVKKRKEKEIKLFEREEQKEEVQHTFNSWKGNNKQIDDVLLWGIKLA